MRGLSSIALDDVSELDSIAAEQASPEDAALEGEVKALVGRFLSGLSPIERRFADLRFVERLSQERAGAELGLSRQEVRTREVRIKQALVEFLEAEGWLDPSPDVPRSAEHLVATLLFLVIVLGGGACT